jgi:hypothetical protein
MFVACSHCGGHGKVYFSSLRGVPAGWYNCSACIYRRNATYARLIQLGLACRAALRGE